jgi:hypothetical protein
MPTGGTWDTPLTWLSPENFEISYDSRVALRDWMHDQPELEAFNGEHTRVLLGDATPLGYDQLATWLVWRTTRLGAASAVRALGDYMSADHVPYLEVMVLAGLYVESPVHLSNGIALVPYTEVPASQAKAIFDGEARELSGFAGRNAPTSAAIRSSTAPLSHVRSGRDVEYKRTQRDGAELARQRCRELRDACLILSVIRPHAPIVVAEWWTPDDSVPCTPDGNYPTIHFADSWSEATRLLPESYEQVKHVHSAFVAMPEGGGQGGQGRAQLRMPLQRLNRAIRSRPSVDSAVDLGIALETIFAGGSRDELNYKLRVRAARFLGRSSEERRELFDRMGALYSLRSDVAHEGDFKEKRRVNAGDLLSYGYDQAAHAIEAIIRNGWPDFDEVVLS